MYYKKINFRGRWSLQEDNILLKNIAQKGRKWARISRLLQGRNEYAVKNHFYLLMKKYKINPNSQNFCLEIKSLLQSLINSPQSSSSFSKISKHIKKPSFSSNFNCSNALKKLEFNTIAKAKEEPKNQKNNTQIKRENIQETIKIEETKMENQTTEYRSNLKIETNEIKKRESLMMMDFCKSVQENVRLNSWFGMDNPYNPYQMNIITLRQQQMQYLLCKFLEGQPNKLKFNQ